MLNGLLPSDLRGALMFRRNISRLYHSGVFFLRLTVGIAHVYYTQIFQVQICDKKKKGKEKYDCVSNSLPK